MAARLLLFDVDGTLIDTAGAGRTAILRAFSALFGVDGIEARVDRVRFAGMTDPVIFAALAEAAGIVRPRFEAALVDLLGRYLAELEAEMRRPDPRRRVLPGVRELLEALDGRDGLRLGLLTGNLEHGARTKLEPFGLNRYFPDGGFGSDHADRAEVARIAVRKLSHLHGIRFSPEHVTVIGDTEHDVACARANGYRAVAVATGWVPIEVLERAAPDVLLTEMTSLPDVLAGLGVA